MSGNVIMVLVKYKFIRALLLFQLFSQFAIAQNKPIASTLRYPELVMQFTGQASLDPIIRQAFRQLLDSCNYVGLNRNDYHYNDLFKHPIPNQADNEWIALYKDALIGYCKDLYQGHGVATQVSYSGISNVSAVFDSLLLIKLSNIQSKEMLINLVDELEPKLDEYAVVKDALWGEINKQNIGNVKQLQQTLNNLRWVSHFRFDKCIVVNIAAARLSYYEHDSLLLTMKIVAGKPSTKTPRFSAYCDQVILYPYWHVPRSIVIKELLPASKKRPGILNMMNIQVIDAKGNVVNSSKINWRSLNKNNFPYQLRQSTGCDNALGVIKFNLTSPYSVYMHDTNLKSVFNANQRYFSHGCIRIEKPIELANYLLPQTIDSNFLKQCIKNQQPVTYSLKNRVPVFVLYMTADVVNNNVVYYKDIYDLMP